jgi:hypothetical protein
MKIKIRKTVEIQLGIHLFVNIAVKILKHTEIKIENSALGSVQGIIGMVHIEKKLDMKLD